jgi:hypothetical protein
VQSRIEGRHLLLITTTYPNPNQLVHLAACAEHLRNRPNVTWFVAEDRHAPSEPVTRLLQGSGVAHEHIAVGPSGIKGHPQRAKVLELIRARRMQGVVYSMDDDNACASLR